MFGLLWEWRGRVWIPKGHFAPFPRGVKRVSESERLEGGIVGGVV
jgi:hypothetical protein